MNEVQMYTLRGTAAPTAAQLVSSSATVLEALSRNPFLAGDGTHAVIANKGGGSHVAVIRATLRDGRGCALVQPIEITTNDKITASCPNGVGTLNFTQTGVDFATCIVTPSSEGAIEVELDFGAANAGATFFIRHPYCALPVASRPIG